MLHQQSWFLIFNFLFGNNFNLSKDSRKSTVQITSWYFVKKIHLLQLFDLIWLITSSSSLSPCFCMFSSVTQSCPTLCDPMDCSTPGFSVHQLAQTHVHWVGDAIQPYHPLSSPSPPAFNLSQHQGLFQWLSYSHQVAKGLEFQLQHQSSQWIFSIDFI